ncbi:hypothetical protein CLIB1444_02S03796 [[Candida] jaroonii]|uniref:Uncharacterized protein n=1 Tax=[Candida] jaroonii TaxID=467808 RepID=A0ACA9Y2S7_9ASCO|nr:hypothetical protein CLIB1444_02S03796 [[Candida] jaroonii]
MSVFIVDNELTSSIKELGEIFDQVQETEQFTTTLSKYIDETNEITQKDALIKEIYNISKTENLIKLNDKDFESTFNLIIYILVELQGDIEKLFQNDELLNNLIQSNPKETISLRDKKSIKSTSILSELTLIFNLLDESSETRIKIIKAILNFFKSNNLEFKIIEKSFTLNLNNWLSKINNIKQEDIKSIFWEFILLDNNHSLNSLKLIKEFTKDYEVTKDELLTLIKFSLNSKTIDLSFMINTNISQSLAANKSDSLVELFIKYLNGELIQSSEFPLIESKSKILSLCKFFDNSGKFVFKFDEIPAAKNELEILIINSIKNNLIEGKLDQLNETFKLIRVNKSVLPYDNSSIENNLLNVKKNLTIWRDSLINVDKVVQNFRENTK